MPLKSLVLIACLVVRLLANADEPAAVGDPATLTVAEPAMHWDFSANLGANAGTVMPSAIVGNPSIEPTGPAAPEFPRFASGNSALQLDGKSRLVFNDPGRASIFDFTQGDAIAVEAWIRISSIEDGQQVYIIGKGRTHNPGMPTDNQNWALRLRGMGGTVRPSLLYRSADRSALADVQGNVTLPAKTGEFHRWNTDIGFEPDGRWHHVAVSFKFGTSQPPIAWIDGQPVDGAWDMGGNSFANPPRMDDDQVWIGSSMGGNPGNSFRGAIDELSLFRRELTDKEIQSRFQTTRRISTLPEIADSELPAGAVVLEVREFVRLNDPWNRDRTRVTMRWQQPVAAITTLPRKYGESGLIMDRTNPTVLQMRFRMNTPEVSTQFLIRARSGARLLIDDREVAQLTQTPNAADGHQEVPVPPELLYPSMHPAAAGDQEAVVPVTLTAGSHLIEFESLIGGRNMRVEASETLVAMGSPERGFELLSPSDISYGLNEPAWRHFAAEHQTFIAKLEQQERTARGGDATEYWNRRHATARQLINANEQSLSSADVDAMLSSVLETHQLSPLSIVDDRVFLRRLTLNTVGMIPSRDEMSWFLDQPAEARRSMAIDRFLNDTRWADHWVAYWQDVLAENPGILKPELNNTGPFRWWIYESFLDNKPTDRFATELVMMKGSRLGGGPAGFAMASQNDVPLADRALVLSTAFSGREMKCARCHDSPVSDVAQQQLFALAAMLNRAPITIPKTSSVPKGPHGERSKLITVSIEPGSIVAPQWPFSREDQLHDQAAWDALLIHPGDSREQAALHLTHPTESAFAEVIVNRLWARLFGQGLIPHNDNWSSSETDHRFLLTALARQHIASGYDLKSTARLILNTQAWQRKAAPEDAPVAKYFGATTVRRMSAEQMLDSLYAAVGKSFDAEMLTLDPEGRRPDESFLNLGIPQRAWQFCSLSNERDRPALALPMAQSLIDLLTVFGWRDSRPHAISTRDEQATVLQPLTLANGNAGHRLVQLSDRATTTAMALQAQQPGDLVSELFEQVLSRKPTEEELELFAAELTPGFVDRIVPDAQPAPIAAHRSVVSWSNHLNKEATRIKQELEDAARLGDPPTKLLTESWRIQAEDVVWVLLNSPEFAFVP